MWASTGGAKAEVGALGFARGHQTFAFHSAIAALHSEGGLLWNLDGLRIAGCGTSSVANVGMLGIQLLAVEIRMQELRHGWHRWLNHRADTSPDIGSVSVGRLVVDSVFCVIRLQVLLVASDHPRLSRQEVLRKNDLLGVSNIRIAARAILIDSSLTLRALSAL